MTTTTDAQHAARADERARRTMTQALCLMGTLVPYLSSAISVEVTSQASAGLHGISAHHYTQASLMMAADEIRDALGVNWYTTTTYTSGGTLMHRTMKGVYYGDLETPGVVLSMVVVLTRDEAESAGLFWSHR